jgi:hypothetical protein
VSNSIILRATAKIEGGLNWLQFYCGEPDEKVQLRTSWVAVSPPLPAAKPTYAVFPPTTLGMFTAQLVVKVSAGVLASVIVMVNVVPS